MRIAVEPMGAPRQTRSDKWRPRDCVLRYRQYRDIIRIWTHPANLPLGFPADLFVRFTVTMPPSWSQKKRDRMRGSPHQQKPDLDNMQKGLLDAVFRDEDDAHIWRICAEKVWGDSGSIDVFPLSEAVMLKTP